MSDYRSWCHSCGNEIAFGGHAKDCAWEKEVWRAKKEKQEFEDLVYRECEERSTDDLIEEALELTRTSKACHQAMLAADNKLRLLEYHIVSRGIKETQDYRERQKSV